MEVSGIEGNYRLTCERVMRVLRENNDSLVATLEAFVYDPLISWRLLNSHRRKDRKGPEGRAAVHHGEGKGQGSGKSHSDKEKDGGAAAPALPPALPVGDELGCPVIPVLAAALATSPPAAVSGSSAPDSPSRVPAYPTCFSGQPPRRGSWTRHSQLLSRMETLKEEVRMGEGYE